MPTRSRHRRFREGSRERPTAERHTLGSADHSPKTALEEGIRGRHPVTAASFKPVHPSRGRYQPAPERGDEIMSDHDLKQLEASLRWLQRQEAGARLTRAAPLLPVPGLASAHTTDRHHNSEMPVNRPQAARSLEPERLAHPFAMSSRRYNLRWPLGIVVASIFAAAIAYYFLVGSWSPRPGRRLGHWIKRSLRPSRQAHKNPVRVAPNMILKRFQLRCHPSTRAYRRRDHPRARRRRCCRRRLRPLEKSSAPLIPRKSNSSQDKPSN